MARANAVVVVVVVVAMVTGGDGGVVVTVARQRQVYTYNTPFLESQLHAFVAREVAAQFYGLCVCVCVSVCLGVCVWV